MADVITVQELQDARLDAQAFEQFINGDVTQDVLTRFSKRYPTLQKALKELFGHGGIAGRFRTLVELQASPLVDGSYALVADDVADKNGIYIKEAGSWVKSSYNPEHNAVLKALNESKYLSSSYANNIAKGIDINNDVYLDANVDVDGNVYRYTDKDGGIHLKGLKKSGTVQELINNALPITNDDANISHVVDITDNVVAYIDKDSNLHIKGSVYAKGNELKSSSAAAYTAVDRSARLNVLTSIMPEINTITTVHGKGEDGDNAHKRMMFGIRTATGILAFYHRQTQPEYDGDTKGSELWKAIIDIDDNTLAVSVRSKALFLSPDVPEGIVKHPMLCRLLNNNILLVYEKRSLSTDVYKQYYRISTDDGLTFSDPEELLAINNSLSSSTVRALGTTGDIVRTKTGRLTIPMYLVQGSIGRSYCLYSDDDGVTWLQSGLTPESIHGYEPAVIVDDDNRLMMDIRPANANSKRVRLRAVSLDNGETWQEADNIETFQSATNQAAWFRDDKLGLIINGHSATTWARKNYTLRLSFDNGVSFPYTYVPIPPEQYTGYSQIVKIKDGGYALLVENSDSGDTGNQDESVKIIMLTISEVMNHVSYN